jgi:hypothetical protein
MGAKPVTTLRESAVTLAPVTAMNLIESSATGAGPVTGV